jgi:putative salt-induced outer membrane protein YdiY
MPTAGKLGYHPRTCKGSGRRRPVDTREERSLIMSTRQHKSVCVAVFCLALALFLAATTFAGDQPGTYFKGDLSLVQTAGNSQAGTLGGKLNFTKNGLRSAFVMNWGAVRTQSKETARTASGTSQDNFTITETSLTKTSAENYFANAQVSYRVTESFYCLAGGAWSRDLPSGVKSRLMEMAGVGYDLAKSDRSEFKLQLAATFTQESTVVADPAAKKSYPGLRLSYAYKQKASDTTSLTHSLTFDQPFSPSSNFRIDGQAGVEVSMTRSGALALKLDARLMYDNMPALEELQLQRPDGVQSSTRVTSPLNKLDAQFTVSFVVNIARKGGVGRQKGR